MATEEAGGGRSCQYKAVRRQTSRKISCTEDELRDVWDLILENKHLETPVMNSKSLFITALFLKVISPSRCQLFSPSAQCSIRKRWALFNGKYVQDGDLIIGGVFTVSYYQFLRKGMNDVSCYCEDSVARYYRYILAFIFAIDEINKNPDILPNLTLGYHVHDSCNNFHNAIDSVLQILSGPGDTVPNYHCGKFGSLAGVIGEMNPDTSLILTQILSILGYSQISYGTMDPILTNSDIFPSFFQALPNYQTQRLAILQLLRHYKWTWIGIITTDDDVGEKQSQELKAMAGDYGICVEYIIKIDVEDANTAIFRRYKATWILNNSTSQVIVICGKYSDFILIFIQYFCIKAEEKTFILPAGLNKPLFIPNFEKTPLHGSLVFSPPTRKMPDLKRFLQDVSIINRPHDFILESILALYFCCLTHDPIRNKLLQSDKHNLYECNRTITLGEICLRLYDTEYFAVAYLVYKSVYAMAHALHEMAYLGICSSNHKYQEMHTLMQKYLRRANFIDPFGEDVQFNEKGEMTSSYEIFNYFCPTKRIIASRKVGHFNALSQEGDQLEFDDIEIFWKNSDIPVSTCSDQCPPGFKQTLNTGLNKCCFECLKCSEGEISNESDRASCQKCPEDQWPNNINQCVLKPTEYLSYSDCEPTVIMVYITCFLSFIKTSSILGIFILFKNTPVVRANNKSLSFILLGSIMLSFLCVFLFLGLPTHVTCMLRQTSFGIIFSVAISSILAKTILVYMAFKATKPGSSWNKFIGVKLTKYVVFFCSFLQVLLNIIWLSTSPPFPERNIHLYQDKIIFQCNEGSMLAFSILLGYMGLLAAVSFTVAFLARHLPDTFNEAKNITFSMLVVCSVWVAFIPAYMSVAGKNTVLVEIFAIISSSFGILSCIFFPKCYIILMRPDLNSKSCLVRQIKENSIN